jgi:hypothetical protein
MKSVTGRTLRLAVLGVALLAAGAGCNDIGNEGDVAEAVVLVTGVSVAGAGAGDGLNTSVTLSLTVEDRTGGYAESFFNDVVFTVYSVVFSPTLVVPDVTGAVNSGYVPVGGTATLTLDIVTSGMEAAGATVIGTVSVTGHDVNGRPVNFSHPVAVTFTP